MKIYHSDGHTTKINKKYESNNPLLDDFYEEHGSERIYKMTNVNGTKYYAVYLHIGAITEHDGWTSGSVYKSILLPKDVNFCDAQ